MFGLGWCFEVRSSFNLCGGQTGGIGSKVDITSGLCGQSWVLECDVQAQVKMPRACREWLSGFNHRSGWPLFFGQLPPKPHLSGEKPLV